MLGVELPEEGITLLVKLHGLFGVNFLVIKIENLILEAGGDRNICFEIDWGLLGS